MFLLKNKIFLYLHFFLIFFVSLYLKSDVYDYIYPNNEFSYSNYGGLGLIQNPSARFYREGTLAFSWSHNEPYLRGSILAYPFNWFEASFQYTDFNNELYSQSREFSGSQTLKDKSFDAKFLILEERKYLPQIAFGLRDLGGTGRFASEYFVMNKFLGRSLDISVGIGWGNLNGNGIRNPLTSLSDSFNSRNQGSDLGGKININNFLSGEAGYFAGLEYSIPYSRGIKFKVELDGTNYQTESTKPLNQDSKINFGFIYPVTRNFILKLSSTRGNTLNFGFSYKLGLSKSNPRKIIKESPQELDNKDIIKRVTDKSEQNLYRASLLYLSRQGISLQKASVEDDTYHVLYSQARYYSPAMSAGRVIKLIDDISPPKIERIKVTEINGGMGMYTASIDRDAYARNKSRKSPEVIDRYILTDAHKYNPNEHIFNPETKYPAAFAVIGPDLRSQIGGPDGFFFGDLKLALDSEVLFKRNVSLVTKVSYGLYDNMDALGLTSDSVLPHVRTDIIDYLKESRNFSITRLQLNYYNQISKSLFYKLSGGIFESMFNGYGGEMLYRPYLKSYGFGLELWQVYQREYDQMFGTRDYDTVTGHLSFYYQDPRSNVLFHLRGGRYLAKDSGVTFDFSRIFRSGMRVGAFFSLTDISFEEFGEGSFDKGFYFHVPLEIFSQRYFKRNFSWGLRPLTRDGAQSLGHGYPLWGVTDSSSDHRFRRRLDDFYD